MAEFGFVIVMILTIHLAYQNFDSHDFRKIYWLALTVFPAICFLFAYVKGRENTVLAMVYIACGIAIALFAFFLKRKTSS